MPQDRYKVLIHSDDFYKLFNESNSNITYSIKCFHDNPSHRDSDLNEKKIYFENLNRSFNLAILPSSFITSQITELGFNFDNFEISIDASV